MKAQTVPDSRGSSPAMTEGYWFDMCIACEMAFWMDMEEAERAASLPKAQPSRAGEAFACDAPETAGDGAPSISSPRHKASADRE